VNLKRHRVVIGYRRAGIGTDVEALQDQRDRALHGVARHLLVVDLEHAGAAEEDADARALLPGL